MKILYFTDGQLSTKEANEIVEKYTGDIVVFCDINRPYDIVGYDCYLGLVPNELKQAHSYQPAKDIESFDLPKISSGARKLIKKFEISDSQLANIKPTGVDGIIADDIKRYLNL